MPTTSLIEELPKIVKEGRQEAQRILERLSSNTHIGLQTNELVLPAKDTSGLWKGKNEQVINKEWINRLIYGDNLLVMQALLAGDETTGLPSLRGKVDLIYIDPPFDSKADYRTKINLPGVDIEQKPTVIEQFAYSDTWQDGTVSYLKMLYPRLVLMRELLSDKGSIYVHIDWHVGAYVKVLMDDIFGKENFINELIWQATAGDTSAKNKKYIKSHDSLYFYSKGFEKIWNDVYQPYDEGGLAPYKYQDENGRYQWRDCSNPGGGGYIYDLGFGEKMPSRGYCMPKETALKWLSNGLLRVEKDKVPRIKQYINPSGVRCKDVWIDLKSLQSAENIGYSFPRLLRIRDTKPPKAPTDFKALPALDGTIALMWNMPDSLDVHYYDVLYANARDHVFNMANHRHVFPRSYTDTVDVNANERYIYYTVRAVDWAGNEGECSDTIAVLRPNPAPPSKAHLDSAWVDNRMIHTRWIGGGDEIIGSYNCYRRKDGTAKWDLLKTFAGDSVRANGYVMQIDDAPGGPMNQRYEYAVETVSLWDISSGLTPVFSAKLNYDKVVDVPIKLLGDFNRREGTVKLVWELSNSPSDAPYFFCLYRKLNGEKSFRYLTDIPQEKRYYVDPRLAPGESAEYYVSIRFDDGRQSLRSNIQSVQAPLKTD